MVPFESLDAVSYPPSIVTMALSCIVYEIEEMSLKNRDFFHTPLHSTSQSEYCHPVRCEKTRMVGLPDGIKTVRICITV